MSIRVTLIFLAVVAVIVVVLHAWNPTAFRARQIVALVFMAVVLLGPGVFRYFTETELAVEDERVVVRTSRKGRVLRTQRVRLDDLSRIIILLFQPNRDSYGMRLGLFADGAKRPKVIIVSSWRTAPEREDVLRRLRELLGDKIPYETRVLPNDYATFKREGWTKRDHDKNQ